MAQQSIELQQGEQTTASFGRRRIRGGIRAVNFEVEGEQVYATFSLQRAFFSGHRSNGVVFALYPEDELRDWAKAYFTPLHSLYLRGRCYVVLGGETYDD